MRLTKSEISLILQSLEYTKEAFRNYRYYPDYQFKVNRIKEVDDLKDKLIELKKKL